MTLSIVTLSVTTFSTTTLSIVTLSVTAFSTVTLSIKGLLVTLSINNNQWLVL